MNRKIFPAIIWKSPLPRAVGVMTLAALAGTAPLKSFGADVTVTVTTHDPTPADQMVRSIQGECYGQSVRVEFHQSTDFPSVVVHVGQHVQTFAASAGFVRPMSAQQSLSDLWLYCNNDPNKQILLAVIGFRRDHGLPAGPPWRASLIFAQDGSLVSFSGMRPIDDPPPAPDRK